MLFDGHGLVRKIEYAGFFAWRRARAAREFGEVVGRVEAFRGFAPPTAIDQVVPFGDVVAERAALVAEGNVLPVHAAAGLRAKLRFRKGVFELEPIANALVYSAAFWLFSPDLEEPSGLSHHAPCP